MNKVMRVIKKKELHIIAQKLELDCKILISVRKSAATHIEKLFGTLYEVYVKRLA